MAIISGKQLTFGVDPNFSPATPPIFGELPATSDVDRTAVVGGTITDLTGTLDDAGNAVTTPITNPLSGLEQADLTRDIASLPDKLQGFAGPTFESAADMFNTAEGAISDFLSDPGAVLDDITDFFGNAADGLSDSITGLFDDASDSVLAFQQSLASELGLADAIDTVANPSIFGSPITTPNTGPPLPPTSNILHNYSSFTYNLTISAMTKDVFNALTMAGGSGKEGVILGSRAIIASGGRDAAPTPRDPLFKEDFYIENFIMNSVIGQSDYTQGSNAIGLEMEIMEPYGATLIDRIAALAKTLEFKTITEIPYVIKIEFKGYDDAGGMPKTIPGTTKYIPFNIVNITFKTDDKGTLYKIDAVPVNHYAFNQNPMAIHNNISIAASSVEQFFNGIPTGKTDGMYKSLSEIINEYNISLTQSDGSKPPARMVADVIAFEIEPFISQNKIVVNNNKDRPEKVVGDKAIKQEAVARSNLNASTVATDEATFRFNSGTSVISIINSIVKSSEYVLQQIKDDTSKECDPDKPLSWYRIIPKIEYLEYDELARRHAYKTTYVVTTYDIYGQKLPVAPQGKPNEVVKEYNYMFTGFNQDIIDLDLEFNMAYFTALSRSTTTAALGTNDTPGAFAKAFADSGGIAPGDAGVGPMSQAPVESTGPNQQVGGNAYGDKNTKRYLAADLENSLLTSSRGDMLVVDLNILGDPSLIKQDDVLYQAHEHRGAKFTPTGSILQDTGEVYFRLNFRIPDDIDHDKGLLKFGMSIGGENKNNVFSGLYRIMTFDNKFANGQFTQQCVLMRVYNQDPCQNSFDEEGSADSAASCDALCMLSKEGHTPGDDTAIDTEYDALDSERGTDEDLYPVNQPEPEPTPEQLAAEAAARGAGSGGNTGSGAIDEGLAGVLEEVAEGEGTTDAQALAANKDFIKSGYDVPFGYGKYLEPPKPLTQMTIDEVLLFQKQQIYATKGTFGDPRYGTSAVGKYQIISSTLVAQQKALGISGKTLFSAEVQDRMGANLIKSDGYDKMVRGDLHPAEFQRNVSKTWASVTDPFTGSSYYGQPVGTSSTEFQTAASNAKTLYQNTPPPTALHPPTVVTSVSSINNIPKQSFGIDPSLYAELGVDPRLM